MQTSYGFIHQMDLGQQRVLQNLLYQILSLMIVVLKRISLGDVKKNFFERIKK
jgi:hypothetical protein